MNPDASTLAAGTPIEFDLGEVEPGGYVVVLRRKRPIFAVFRTPEMLEALQDPKLLNELADPRPEQHQQRKHPLWAAVARAQAASAGAP